MTDAPTIRTGAQRGDPNDYGDIESSTFLDNVKILIAITKGVGEGNVLLNVRWPPVARRRIIASVPTTFCIDMSTGMWNILFIAFVRTALKNPKQSMFLIILLSRSTKCASLS